MRQQKKPTIRNSRKISNKISNSYPTFTGNSANFDEFVASSSTNASILATVGNCSSKRSNTIVSSAKEHIATSDYRDTVAFASKPYSYGRTSNKCERPRNDPSSRNAFSSMLLCNLKTITTTIVLVFAMFVKTSETLKCLDCVGRDCMGSFCDDGDYCVLAHYAPRWGTIEWGEPRVVKGCMSGSMIRKDIRSHCETADENGQEVFTCFCNNKDYCNGDKAVERLEVEPVQLLTCACEGSHCKEKTCLGELCSYVINHKTKQTEQGCVNASVPLVERRSSGACMIPPITGAMHHTVAKTADDLLVTESCVCGTDYCNVEKPEPKVPERMKCQTFVRAEVMGTKMASRNVTCEGEFCFKAKISSKIGHMSQYNTIGCASFINGAELPEEMNPTGCAKFSSENVNIEACMQTTDKRAIARARANQQVVDGRPRSKPKAKSRRPTIEVSYEEDEDEEKEKENRRVKGKAKPREEEEEKEEEEEEKSEEEKVKEKENEDQQRRRSSEKDDEGEENEGEAEGEEEDDADDKEKPQDYIFERPTLPPEPEDSNAGLVAVFLCLILLIALSGVVYKFQLHKRLFRANYDTVAGG